MCSFDIQNASSSNPTTWSDFNTAMLALNSGYYDYLGYVFYNGEYIGIDIDVGFKDGFISELACDIISHCKSYTELSKSGRGYHIILKGTLPFEGRNNRKGVEIYSTGRYFIMTGKTFMYKEIVENQDAIDYVLQKYFDTERGEKGSYNMKLEKLYSPTWDVPGGTIPLAPK